MGRTVIREIAEGIAQVEGVESESLTVTIEDYVSTDAIRSLVNHKSNSWQLQFETPNHDIMVKGNNTIIIDGGKLLSTD